MRLQTNRPRRESTIPPLTTRERAAMPRTETGRPVARPRGDGAAGAVPCWGAGTAWALAGLVMVFGLFVIAHPIA